MHKVTFFEEHTWGAVQAVHFEHTSSVDLDTFDDLLASASSSALVVLVVVALVLFVPAIRVNCYHTSSAFVVVACGGSLLSAESQAFLETFAGTDSYFLVSAPDLN
jgi:hypothetical protein